MLKYEYPLLNLYKEFELIKKTKGTLTRGVSTNKIVLTFQPNYYEKENILWEKSEIQDKLYLNREKFLNKKRTELNDKEILRGFKISGIHLGYSQHSPFWIKYFIEKYNIKSIYDPCGGWGHRLLGAWDIKYIYNDTNIKAIEGIKNIISFLNLFNKKIYNEDCSEFICPEEYESVFTCPPYFKNEIYDGENSSILKYNNYSSWLNIWWYNTVKNSVNEKVKYFSFIINNKYKEDMKLICQSNNLELIEDNKVGYDTNLNHFQRSSKVKIIKKGENLLIFKNKKYNGYFGSFDIIQNKENILNKDEIKLYWELNEKIKKERLI